MKLLILGGSGGVGKHLIRLAVEQGHTVTALMRSRQPVPDSVRLVLDDVLRPGCLSQVVVGQEVVLSALGIKRSHPANPFSALVSPPDFTSVTAQALVQAMQQQQVKRVLAVSASGVGDSAGGLNLMMRLMIAVSNVGANYRDLERMEAVYRASGLDFCCVRPTGLTDGPLTHQVKQIADFPLTARISRADVAAWMLQHITGELSDRFPIITGAQA